MVVQATYTWDPYWPCQCAVLGRGRKSRGGRKGSTRSPLNQVRFKHILEFSLGVFLNGA